MTNFLTLCAIAVFVLTSFYIGMSKDLCNMELSEIEYKKMQLDCSHWLYK